MTKNNVPNHVAIIMDGNGRWAKQHHQLRIFGHKHGAEVISKIAQAAIDNKVKVLSLFAFSTENWNRPKHEVSFLMKLMSSHLDKKTINDLNKHRISFRWIGFKNKLNSKLVDQLLSTQNATKRNKDLILNICFNYGGQQDILQAAKKTNFTSNLLTKDMPPVDLLIRTGDEKRISNFLLWQSAYAEIIFESTYWPSYNKNRFNKNIKEYQNRKRRFGSIHE
ncbi:MAG: di-trans,poly-cis-decaprenylcistransferase [Mycoplasmataceae bacterium]|jgi:undecaprenyl diphosphate synthase|nr:di-trans,poly-cis-decaprenylcistransferase [Mycoplasmataceae bacterium]